MRHVASCSFGKDSLAMILRLIEEHYPLDEVIFYDTGMEFQAIYDIRDRMLLIFKQHNIKYTELTRDRPFMYDMVDRPVCSKEKGKHYGFGWCGGVSRWGTSDKTSKIDKCTRDADVIYIGIAADEPDRLARLSPPKQSPLAEWGMTERDCLDYCYDRGFYWEENGVRLYDILDRVSCWCCSNKNRRELKNIYLYLPEYWEKLKDIQGQLERPMKSFKNNQYGEYGDLFELEKVFEKELGSDKKPFLYDFQKEAVKNMRNGCILNGSVGSGKSRTGLFYYFKENGGWIDERGYKDMKNPKDLYIITTAMKRDKCEWTGELSNYLMSPNPEVNYYKNKIVVDSWNNIMKYVDIKDAFFIFDEDRVTGSGVWVKSFLKITKFNDWIILSATPGDTWSDYIPVFLANGFYKNKTEFAREHVIYARYSRYPKIDRYVNTGRLIRQRNQILIDMDFTKHTIPHHIDVYCRYDIPTYKDAIRTRWDPFKNAPIEQASGLCYVLRRVVNTDDSRIVALMEILDKTPRAIIFYNFDYELEILKNLAYQGGVEIAEWNGHRHEPIPESDKWVYLVQYSAGCEGWNSIATDTIIFFSQNYSYKVMTQAAGRIDRLNTKFIDLYYYHLKTRSGIDLAITKALNQKKNFNEGKWVGAW